MDVEEEGAVSDDDIIEECKGATCLSLGMTKAKKIEARRTWWNSLIIKLIGRSIWYHFPWRRIQTMWRTQSEPLLIDLGNDFFIVKLGSRSEYEWVLSEGTWMIGGHYLHVQRWRPNFVADLVEITSLFVLVRFPTLPVKFYTETWLRSIGDQLGKTIKVVDMTLATTRGRFARVCIELDLKKPLYSRYLLRGREWQLQYEG